MGPSGVCTRHQRRQMGVDQGGVELRVLCERPSQPYFEKTTDVSGFSSRSFRVAHVARWNQGTESSGESSENKSNDFIYILIVYIRWVTDFFIFGWSTETKQHRPLDLRLKQGLLFMGPPSPSSTEEDGPSQRSRWVLRHCTRLDRPDQRVKSNPIDTLLPRYWEIRLTDHSCCLT